MDCVVCGGEALELSRARMNRSFDCRACGVYEAQGDFSSAYYVVATGVRDILERQRQEGIELPIITGQSAFLLYALSRVSINGKSLSEG